MITRINLQPQKINIEACDAILNILINVVELLVIQSSPPVRSSRALLRHDAQDSNLHLQLWLEKGMTLIFTRQPSYPLQFRFRINVPLRGIIRFLFEVVETQVPS